MAARPEPPRYHPARCTRTASMRDHCPATARARVLRALSRYAQTALTPEQVHTTKVARAVVRVVPGFDPRAGPLGPWPRTTIRGCGRLLGAKAAAAADAAHEGDALRGLRRTFERACA